MVETLNLSSIQQQIAELTTLVTQAADDTKPPKWWQKQDSRLSMLESKMASQQRNVEHILQLLTGKKSEEKNDDSQVFDKLPTSKIQITAYVDYFGQFTSEQLPEDIAEHISQSNEEARPPFVKKYKTFIHPGEVNRIRELPQKSEIVATHTDSPDVLIWDVEAQPNRHAVLGAAHSRPDLILTGHQDNAEITLEMCPTESYVISGGKDKSVVWWNIKDHISGGSIIKQNKFGEGNDKAVEGPSVGPRDIFCGHEDTVEDVAFSPSSAQEFCSVGDDSCLILWDARVGTSPAVKVEKAYDANLHCVDWNHHDDNLVDIEEQEQTILENAQVSTLNLLETDGMKILEKLGKNTATYYDTGWRAKDKNRIGHGDKETRLKPTCVLAQNDYNFHKVACGHGLTVGLTTSMNIFTRRSIVYGQFGNPFADGKIPCLVEDKLSGECVEEIACGAYLIAALTSRNEDRHVKYIACGSNYSAAICLHKWVSGTEESQCSACRQALGVDRKKHNCYNYGLVHCHSCSSRKALRAALALNHGKPFRVCYSYFTKRNKVFEAGNNRMNFVPRLSAESKDRLDKAETFSLVRSTQAPSLLQLKDIALSTAVDLQWTVPKPILIPSGMSSRSVSPSLRKLSPPRSATPVPIKSEFCFPTNFMDKFKKTNDLLNQEVLKLCGQVATLRMRCELQKSTMKAQEAMSLAAEESATSEDNKEVIQSLTAQLKDMAERLPPGVYESESIKPTFLPNGLEKNGVHCPYSKGLGHLRYDSIGGSFIAFPTALDSAAINDHSDNRLLKGTTGLPEENSNLPEVIDERESGYFRESENSMKCRNSASVANCGQVEADWIEQYEPGVYIILVALQDRTKGLLICLVFDQGIQMRTNFHRVSEFAVTTMQNANGGIKPERDEIDSTIFLSFGLENKDPYEPAVEWLIDEGKLIDALALSDRFLSNGASDKLLQLLIERGEGIHSNSRQPQGYEGHGIWRISWQYCLRLKDKQLAAGLALNFLGSILGDKDHLMGRVLLWSEKKKDGEEDSRMDERREKLGMDAQGLGIEKCKLGIEACEGHMINLPDELEQAEWIQEELEQAESPAEERKG
ncbi:WD-40 repeat-containing protein MSI4 [Hibiscus syriacus]|uniref:WD-40 repeat-containing protein MSI4 n=1 Tax=Hibiscus syriacus TaxID=106335 RepID=A0A6A2Z1Q4_HIBSY|nr:WD-40 repeat-containing protein MSI4 [Hibiscus syriacus]